MQYQRIQKIILMFGLLMSNVSDAEDSRFHQHIPSGDASVDITFSVPHAPPFSSTDTTGESSGYMFEVMAVLLSQSGFSYRHFPLPIKRHYRALLNGECQLTFLPAALPSKPDAFVIGKQVAVEQHVSIYWRKDGAEAKSLNDLLGKRVAVVHGLRYGKISQHISKGASDIDVFEAPSQEAALHLLMIGRVDYLVAYEVMVNSVVTEDTVRQIASHPLGKVQNYLAVHTSVPGAQGVLDTLERTLVKMNNDGTKQAVYNKYRVPTW